MNKLWEMARTRRWHLFDAVHQNIADHSFGVAMLIARLHPNPSAYLLKAALFHDLSEGITGDMPADFKWSHPEVADAYREANHKIEVKIGLRVPLDKQEQLWLKSCDLLEALMFCDHQIRMGNKYMEAPRERIWHALQNMEFVPAPVMEEFYACK